MTKLRRIGLIVMLLIFGIVMLLIFGIVTLVSIFSLQVIAQNENLTVTTDIDKVNVNEVSPVTITVVCGASNNCNQGDPVKADVALDGAGFSYNDKTDDTGTVTVQVNPTTSGIITLTATNGSDTGTANIQAVGSVNPSLQISSDTNSLNINTPTSVTFTVTQSCPAESKKCIDGSPVPGAKIDFSGAVTASGPPTDINGQATISINAISAGDIIVTATKPKYDSGNTTIKAIGVVGAKLPKLIIVADKASVFTDAYTDITFKVTNNQDVPVPNAYIHLINAEYTSGYTDNNGQAIITVNPTTQGVITAKASAAGYSNGSTNISVINTGSSIPLNISTNNSGVSVGVPESVTYSVTRICGTIPGENCTIPNSPVPVADANVIISGVASGSGITNNNGKAQIIVNAGSPGVVTAGVSKSGYNSDSTDMNATMAIDFSPDHYTKYYRGEPVNLILANNGGVPIQLGSWFIRNNTNGTTDIVHISSPIGNGIGSGNLNPGQNITLSWDQKNNSDINNTQCGPGDYIAEAGYSFNGVNYVIDTGFRLSSCIGIVYPTNSITSIDGQDINLSTDDMTNTSRKWNVSWKINGIEVSNQTDIKQISSYFNDSTAQGVWNVTAVATDGCSSMSWSWIWTVSKPSCINVQNYRNMTTYAGQATTFKTGNLSDISNSWNFTWYVNGARVFNETGVSQSIYNNSGGSVGVNNVTAVATQDCNQVNWTWSWTVLQKPYKGGGTSAGGSSGGGGGSGSGGGGGIVSAEPFTNILKFERQDADLKDGLPVPYTFSTPEFSIYQVLISGRSNEAGVGMRVEHLKNTSALVSRLPVGIIYANENVWLESKRIKDILVRFKVNNSWLATNNIAKENIQLLRFNDGWKRLPTNVTGNDNNYTYFESRSSGLSSFAVSGFPQNDIGIPTENAANIGPIAADTPRVTASSSAKKSSGFGILLGVGIISVAYIIKRRIRIKWK